MNLFQQHSRLKARLERKFQQDSKIILSSIKKAAPFKISKWLNVHKTEFKIYSPVKWHFQKQVLAFLNLSEKLPNLSSSSSDFSSLDDEVFELWNKSEFADVFLKALNKGKSILQASQLALKEFDLHLMTLGERHILKLGKQSPSYRTQTSLGEINTRGKSSKLLETTLHLEGKELVLMTKSLKEMKSFSGKIETGLKIIKKYSPDSWERFKTFTDVIIPIKQKEFVSYSHQDLPGHSMINLYDRDFVDLMDDLLHENGHHHLNYYLNLGKLIDEPIDCIYYSPWRKTLRPIRGIYHAYFTFFWAFNLFSALADAKEKDSIFYLFGPLEKEKIYWRAVEEFWMLDYSYKDLAWAKKKKLINKTGWKFIQEQHKVLTKFKKKIPKWEKKLKLHKSELRDLKKTLLEASKTYKKN